MNVDQRKRKQKLCMCHVSCHISSHNARIKIHIINVKIIDVKVLQLGKEKRRQRINSIKELIVDLYYLSYLKNYSTYFLCVIFIYSSLHRLLH